MRSGIILGATALFALNSTVDAEARWTRVTSANFEMYTTAGERSARDTLRYFEQARSFFVQAMPGVLSKELPVRIVAFNSTKEYEPYRLNEFATAYYHPTADHDYIVMSHTGAETFPTATHEYVHLIVRHAKLNFPPWLNEGIAELYSTFKPMGDKILVGALVPGRYQALLRDQWVPLETIMGAGHDSAYYNEKNKAGSLYNEGWALTHMLALSPEYRAGFPKVMHAISAGTPSANALEEAYGQPLSKIEADLMGYLRGRRFQGVLIPAKIEKSADDLKVEPADDFEVKLLLAQVGDRPGKESATRHALEELIASKPARPEPHVSLAYLDLREKRPDDARGEFAKAFELGARGPQMLWDYGRMAGSAHPAQAEEALAELLKQQPDRLEVRLHLAAIELSSRHAKETLQTLAPVKKVTPEDAPRLLMLLTYANLQTGDRVTARNAADQWKKVAKSDEDRRRAEQVLAAIERSTSGPPPAVTFAVSDAPPALEHRDQAPEPVRAAVRRPSVSGKFVELRCGARTFVVIESSSERRMFLIDDPAKLSINGTGATMELTCGPQQGAQVRIEYDAAPADGPAEAEGVARAVFFNP